MKKAHDTEARDKALDELFERYERRGADYSKSPEYAEQETREINMRANARKSFKASGRSADGLYKYKNGAFDAEGRVSDGDFADYYKASREYTPESNVELDTAVFLQRMDQARYAKKGNMYKKNDKNDVKAKLKAEADKTNPKRKTDASKGEKKQAAATSKIKEVAKVAAKTWIPLEERKEERIVQGGKTKLPVGLILAIIVITVSLMLIVASAVLLSSAQSEQNELEDKISQLDAQIEELRTDLDRKNAEAYIEDYANEIGMISQEHVNFEYIVSDKTDGVEKQRDEKATLSSLMNWIFQQFR